MSHRVTLIDNKLSVVRISISHTTKASWCTWSSSHTLPSSYKNKNRSKFFPPPNKLLLFYIYSFSALSFLSTHCFLFSLNTMEVVLDMAMNVPAQRHKRCGRRSLRMKRRRRGEVRSKVVRMKLRKLQGLIPGAQDLLPDRLFLQTADYIMFLRTQLNVLKALSSFYKPWDQFLCQPSQFVN